MKLYLANYKGNAQNTYYPHEVEVNTPEQFKQALQYDNMCCRMQGSYRDGKNFLGCNAIMFDVDNTHSDDPDEWKTADDISETFPVNFVLVRSRNYMKEKRKKDKRTGQIQIEEPREKWHIYMPLRIEITDPGIFNQLMNNVVALFPFVDISAIDNARFFYAVDNPHVTFEDNGQCIDEYLGNSDIDDLRQQQTETILEYAENIRNGRYKNARATRDVVKIACSFLDIRNPLFTDPGTDPGEAAADPGSVPGWILNAQQQQARNWFLAWAEHYDVNLGREYRFTDPATNTERIAICVSCPWEDEHSGGQYPDNEAVVTIANNGTLGFICRHSHGSSLHWKDYRKRIETDYLKEHAQEEAPQNQIERQARAEARPDNISLYIKTSMQQDIDRLQAAADFKTGFEYLDEMSGGLYPGLYVIAATSSLGKTTFSHQIADSLAAACHDVLFFSLEQSRLELVSKSITRMIHRDEARPLGAFEAQNENLTSLAIRKGLYSDQVKAAAAEYSAVVGDRMNIV